MDFAGGFGIVAFVWIFVIIAFWGLVIAALVLGVRWLIRQERGGHQPPPPGPRPDDPLEILRQRYARGEIDDEEYQRRLKTLTGR
ncbi:MAG TPA: SHOCT domain-containing protein [Candidatus Limnocylindrales bacterium]|nr:SHOCT domain-containing protein [Candidatus Limnocylindrales bacterium]